MHNKNKGKILTPMHFVFWFHKEIYWTQVIYKLLFKWYYQKKALINMLQYPDVQKEAKKQMHHTVRCQDYYKE